MRFSFKQNLEGYRDVARDAVQEDLSAEEEKQLARELDAKVARAARKRDTSQEAQRAIYDLQERKQEVMKRLHERLAALDRPEGPERDPDARLVRKEGKGYVAVGRNGQVLPVTKGEMMTDMAWGVRYHLDSSVDRDIRKRYLVEEAKAELQELLDQQITLDEVASTRNNEFKRSAFEKRAASTGEESGFLAEKMVKGFLKKLTYDHAVDFEVREADAFDDVVKKIDFIIARPRHERGVGVEESETAEQVGVQFTINDDPEVLERKRAQVARSNENLRADDEVQDVVLVTMPTRSVRSTYQAWQDDPQPGGPDKLWDDETKEQVFASVMQQMIPDAQIKEQWSAITEERPAAQTATA